MAKKKQQKCNYPKSCRCKNCKAKEKIKKDLQFLYWDN